MKMDKYETFRIQISISGDSLPAHPAVPAALDPHHPDRERVHHHRRGHGEVRHGHGPLHTDKSKLFIFNKC